jgi:hypothetical protein
MPSISPPDALIKTETSPTSKSSTNPSLEALLPSVQPPGEDSPVFSDRHTSAAANPSLQYGSSKLVCEDVEDFDLSVNLPSSAPSSARAFGQHRSGGARRDFPQGKHISHEQARVRQSKFVAVTCMVNVVRGVGTGQYLGKPLIKHLLKKEMNSEYRQKIFLAVWVW